MKSAEGGPDLPQRIDLYRPLDGEAVQLRARAKPLDELKKFNSPQEVGVALAEWPQADAWLPLMSRAQAMVVLLDKARAEPVAIVDLRPWL